jgi:hypothetical protein
MVAKPPERESIGLAFGSAFTPFAPFFLSSFF